MLANSPLPLREPKQRGRSFLVCNKGAEHIRSLFCSDKTPPAKYPNNDLPPMPARASPSAAWPNAPSELSPFSSALRQKIRAWVFLAVLGQDYPRPTSHPPGRAILPLVPLACAAVKRSSAAAPLEGIEHLPQPQRGFAEPASKLSGATGARAEPVAVSPCLPSTPSAHSTAGARPRGSELGP